MLKQIDFSKLPEVFGSAIKTAKTLMPDIQDTCITAIMLPMFTHVLSFKRVKTDEYSDGKNLIHLNVYCIDLIPSGGGKDRLKKDVENHMLISSYKEIEARVKNFYQDKIRNLEMKLENATKLEKAKIENEIAKVREIDLIINKCTTEGFVADAVALMDMPYGAFFIIDSEVGLTLIAKDEKQRQAIEALFQGYDGIMPDKSIKMENKKRGKVKGIIINCLLYSDPLIFKDKKLNELFERIMELGIARRTFVTFQPDLIKSDIGNPDETYKRIQQAYKECENIDKNMLEIFHAIPNNAVYKLPQSVALGYLYPYKKKLVEMFNKTNIALEKKEILSRELKAIKLATFCACLNHPNELAITETDFEQGIYLTEFLSQDYINFLAFSSPYNDQYTKVYEFFMEHINESFYKTDLINHHKDIGLSRGFFRREFADIVDGVNELAYLNGYYLEELDYDKNNAKTFTLRKILTPEEIAERDKDLCVDTI